MCVHEQEDELGIVIKNKARLVAQGFSKEEGINYDKTFTLVARIEAIRIFLAFDTYMNFIVYQMDVKSAFLNGKLKEEVYVKQPYGFESSEFLDYVYEFNRELAFFLGLQVKQKKDRIFISQDKYVAEILRKFEMTDGKSSSMIGSLMYLTLSRPDIMFAVCACARFQVTPKASHLHVVKRIFRYLKGKPHLGLWYPKGSPFDLVAYSNSDHAGASLDRKSTTGGCQFLQCRLIYWQCKKQTVVATSFTEAEYVAAANSCAQVLWIQNQLLDYGLTMQVVLSGMGSLKRMLHVTNILSAGSLTIQQIVLNSPCLTQIKNWPVQIKRSLTMNYHPVLTENQSNPTAGFQDTKTAKEEGTQSYVLFPVLYDGDKVVNKDKGKNPVVTIIGFKDLNEEFAECINNSSNGGSVAGPSVSAARLDFTNNTNDFTAAGPLISTAELNFTNNTNDFSTAGPSNPAMPNLEDLSHDADDVGAEADINNMESIISTRSMARGVRDQGGISQMFSEDFHTCMFAYFLSQEEPKRIHQALKDPMYQMDVNSAFLYGTIEEEVYVCQPPGFEDPKHPDKNGYQRGTIDQTLFIKKQQKDILLVQIYVDDIIFGATNKALCQSFEKLIKDKFQMSSMGELTFFLGLQVKQKKDGIFISQDKYVAEILRKFRLSEGKSASTPIDAEKPLLKDSNGEDVDVHTYRSMIGFLMYLTSSRPDMMFAVCAFVRFQVTPKLSHLNAVKRIFRYLKGKPHL
nr:hypothetical protein [Tanacetum cinerariifolium]